MMMSIDHVQSPIPGIDESSIPFSLLDTDLYKLTMQCAVFHQFSTSSCTYKFTNRSPEMMFSRECFEWCKERVMELANVRLHPEELEYLTVNLPYLTPSYLDFLNDLQLDPFNQVEMEFIPKERQQRGSSNDGDIEFGEIAITVKGPWRECILYEVPLMYILCEGYFKIDDKDWKLNHEVIRAQAKAKALRLLSTIPNNPLLFSEFGTRRRRSYKIQEEVLRGLIDGHKEWKASGGAGGGLAGTSNVYLAMKYGLKPIGTIAHEWIMAIAAKEGYKNPNGKAMDLWEQVYPASATSPLHTMLTDTFTIRIFFSEFQSDPSRALRWNGLRHDSGDPIVFAKTARDAWLKVGTETVEKDGKIKPKGRRVVFSDGLDVDEALRIARECEEIGIDPSFGIGTHLTNDFARASSPSSVSKPLNIVVKIHTIDGLDCVKLTDDKGKYTGEKGEVEKVMRLLGIEGEATTSRG